LEEALVLRSTCFLVPERAKPPKRVALPATLPALVPVVAWIILPVLLMMLMLAPSCVDRRALSL